MAQNMGIGLLSAPAVKHKLTNRWTFRVDNICGGRSVEPHFVKVAGRPNWTVEETELNYLNAKTWIPGKVSWETINVQYYDVAGVADNLPLFNWLASVYEFSDPVRLRMGSSRADYTGRGILVLYDGCGEPLEQWVLNDLWPSAVNFGDNLDYASAEVATIDLTLRYSSVEFQHLCPQFAPTSCCTPCGQ